MTCGARWGTTCPSCTRTWSRAVVDRFNEAERGRTPIGLVLEGDRGVGKTHMLRWVRHEVKSRGGYFFLAKFLEGTQRVDGCSAGKITQGLVFLRGVLTHHLIKEVEPIPQLLYPGPNLYGSVGPAGGARGARAVILGRLRKMWPLPVALARAAAAPAMAAPRFTCRAPPPATRRAPPGRGRAVHARRRARRRALAR